MAVVYRLSLAFSFCVWVFGSTVWGAADLVAHYTFDEGQGEVLPDHSSCANHGKIHGAKWVQLNEGAALEFNGKDSYVDCGNAKSLDVAKELTVELWLKPAVYQGGGGLVAWHTGSGWPDERFVIAFSHYTTDNSVYYILADGNFFTRGAWTPPKVNEWIHYAVSMDGNTVRQYQNGILIDEWDQSRMVPDFGGAPLLLGVSKGLGTPHYAGLLDEVKVYKRAIAPAELFESFAAEAVKKSIPVPPGTNRISVRARSSPEEGKLTLTVGVGECRPIRKGMRLNVSVPGTDLKQTVPLDPGCWKYEVSLDPAKLTPQDYVALAALADETGQAIGKTGKAAFRWPTLSTCLNGRGAASEALAATDAFHIVRDGKPQATVIMPKHADKWTQLAVQWLARYVGKATGVSLTVQTDDTAATGNLVSVGHTKQMKEAGLTTDGLQYDGCRMVVRGDTLFLFGRDELQFEVEGAKGTCKAVVTFLEDYAGVRWFLPGDDGAVVPGCDRLAVSKRLDRTVNPAFAYSHGRCPYGFGTPASFANHFRTALKLKSYGGHSYYSWLSKETYFKDHPDYFALIGGKRTGQGNHLCSTDPEVATILLAGIRKEFDRGYDWVALGQEDGYARCQCEKCESMDNFRGMTSPETPCERVLLLHKRIADQCKISHPDKTVHLLVYGPTVWPSTKIDKWPDNTVAEMCVQTPGFVDAWKGKVRAMTGYLYWFDTTLNMGMGIHATPAEIAAKLRFLHEQGFVGLYQIPETNWGLQGPSYYVLGKLMGDSYLDYRVLQRDYCLGLFGKEAGATMNTFFNTLYAVPQVHTKVWPEESIQQLDRLLRTADSQAQEPRHKRWLKLTRDHFDFSALVSRMLSVYSVYKADPKDATWAAVKEAVDRFEAYRDRILRYSDDYTEQAFPGYDEFCRYLAGKYVGYYECYRSKREEVLKQGVRGTPIGWRSGAVSLPLTLDFTKGPPAPRAKAQ